MLNDQEPKKEPPVVRRRLRVPRPAAPVESVPLEKRPEHLYFQVHFQPVPGARKTHFAAIRPKLTERMHDMIRRGQLLMSGGYPSSIGGMWLLKVKSRSEAERLVQDHPAVACNLLTHRLLELEEPMGAIIHQEKPAIAEPIEHVEP
ncbi:MAG TPA: hypothetical protein VGL38_08480 [bacterium]|jgi:uncharacterized protein YciI